MVMKRNIMRKNLRQTIWKSMGRYIAIVLIIALGAAMFVGLLVTKSDMLATTQKFTDDTNMFDLRLLSTYGWTQDDVEKVRQMDGVSAAEGSITLDVIGKPIDTQEELVYRLHSLPKQINKIHLLGGRLPQKANECLVDGSHADDSVLGTKFVISQTNDGNVLEGVTETVFTVVGYVSTPLYMDMSRGTTTLGSGNLASYVYIPSEAFSLDYYTEIGVTISGDYSNYTDEFTAAMETMAEKLKPGITLLAQTRYVNLKSDAEKDYEEGLKEYEDNYAEYLAGKEDALSVFAQALQELDDSQAEIDAGWAPLVKAEKELDDAQTALDTAGMQLVQSKQELISQKSTVYGQLSATYSQLVTNRKETTAALKQTQEALNQLDRSITSLQESLTRVANQIGDLDLQISMLEPMAQTVQSLLDSANAAEVKDQALITDLQSQLDGYRTRINTCYASRQELVTLQGGYSDQLSELLTQRSVLVETEQQLLSALDTIDQGLTDLSLQQAQVDSEFAAAEAEIKASEDELVRSQATLTEQRANLEANKTALNQAQSDLDSGRLELNTNKSEAEEEFTKAEAEFADAKSKLSDARMEIDGMSEPEVYILDRNTNVGYLAVNNNSDIVAGVSRVFPGFFLLVAALVCITTMTRMIEEERTQIGILKALGYKNRTIINKYLFYSGSAAILGCGLGVVVGSIVFPKILWAAYGIILNITPDVVLGFDWPLCSVVVIAYTLVSMFVTWYCCRQSLKAVPAQLMRPKAPTAGKKILLEYLPFWNRISFLNKVMFRNVFRYRQRLLMMLVGIGGCTALLLTGFGIRDSIVDIVGHQFDEVTVYDMEVYFSEGQTPDQQKAFKDKLSQDTEAVMFFYQASMNLEFKDKSKEVLLVAADHEIQKFIDFHQDESKLDMPGPGQTNLSVGVAEGLGVKVGDTITLRSPDMRTLTVEVAGIFENYVYNYAVVLPETVAEQWKECPASQMSYIKVDENQDAHAIAAKIGGMENIMNVTISQDFAEQVGSMLDALDLVVVTIVICAGLLAAIVLYNLTNISITERVREIATIKVLGFNSKESALYVFKENLFLSAMGAGVGLVGGIYLLKFVMSQIKIDMVWFTDRLTPWSFVWAVLLTMLSAVLVDLLLYFKLEKINMAEALKSVE